MPTKRAPGLNDCPDACSTTRSSGELKRKGRRLTATVSPLARRAVHHLQAELRGRMRHQESKHDGFDAEALQAREKIERHLRAFFRPRATLPLAPRVEQVERALQIGFEFVRLVEERD